MVKFTMKIKSSGSFFIGFRGISRLGSAFIFLRWFKLGHICIQVTSLHRWNKQGIKTNFNRKSISRKTTHHQSLHLEVMPTGETLKG